MNSELKQKLNILFKMRNETRINRTKLNSLIDEIKTKLNEIENETIEYIPSTFTFKNGNKTVINTTIEQLADFEDWLCDNWQLRKWQRDFFVFDDIINNTNIQVVRADIRYIEWPAFMEIDGKLKQGKWFVDMKKPIVKSCDKPYIRR